MRLTKMKKFRTPRKKIIKDDPIVTYIDQYYSSKGFDKVQVPKWHKANQTGKDTMADGFGYNLNLDSHELQNKRQKKTAHGENY